MTDTDYQSTLQIGGYSKAYLRSPNEPMKRLPLIDDSIFWRVSVSGVAFGDLSQAVSFSNTGILDTGTSTIMVPASEYNNIMTALLANVTYFYRGGVYYAPCDPATTGYASLFINLSGYLFEVPSSAYVDYMAGYQYCVLSIYPNHDETWILGDTFLKNYYSVWDHANS